MSPLEPPRPSPAQLWYQADEETDHDPEARRVRYLELMREHGHIIRREPGDTSPLLPCGWGELPGNPDDLLTDDEKQTLNDNLAGMVRQRRRAEAESRNLEMP